MRILTSVTQAFEGVGIALDSIRSNKIRAALTIMGVALGVFVVVAMSSVVRGINESFRRDLEASGPTSFFIYRRPIGGFSNPPEWTRSNPGITLDEVSMLERLPSIRAVTAHVGMGASFRYKDKSIPRAGMEVYTPNWTDVAGGALYPGRRFTYAENAKGASSWSSLRRHATSLNRRSRRSRGRPPRRRRDAAESGGPCSASTGCR